MSGFSVTVNDTLVLAAIGLGVEAQSFTLFTVS